jgi:parallel beta-helix repeat protein
VAFADALGALAPRGDGSTDQTTALQNALDDATAAGYVFALNGPHVISGQITVPAGAVIDGTRGSIQQTGSLKTTFIVSNADDVTIRNATLTGLRSDYTNTSGVYAAAAVYVSGTSSNVRVIDCDLIHHAGAGVRIADTASNVTVRGCRIVGPGATYITSTTYNYSGGVVGGALGLLDVTGNDISDYSQGVVNGGDAGAVRVVSNRIHDIPGQHGVYLASAVQGTISDNIITDCALCGIKVQVGGTTVNDPSDIVIADNSIVNVGSQGVLLTRAAGTATLRRITVTGNTITGTFDDGVSAIYAAALIVSDNVITDTRRGVYVEDSTDFAVSGNRIKTTALSGITVMDSQDYEVRNNRVANSGSDNNSSSEFGILLSGATTAEGVIDGNVITDTLGNARYGIYFATADQATHSVRNNYATGMTDYGARVTSTTTGFREWTGNVLSGASGDVLSFPTVVMNGTKKATHAGTAAPASGTWAVGDTVRNTAPAEAGSTPNKYVVTGWVCTAAGTPGTWLDMRSLTGN